MLNTPLIVVLRKEDKHVLIVSKANLSGGPREDCPSLLEVSSPTLAVSTKSHTFGACWPSPSRFEYRDQRILMLLQKQRITLIHKRHSGQWMARHTEELLARIRCMRMLTNTSRLSIRVERTGRMEDATLSVCTSSGDGLRILFHELDDCAKAAA